MLSTKCANIVAFRQASEDASFDTLLVVVATAVTEELYRRSFKIMRESRVKSFVISRGGITV